MRFFEMKGRCGSATICIHKYSFTKTIIPNQSFRSSGLFGKAARKRVALNLRAKG